MTASPWRAPVADSPVDATVAIPGSKSITARALYLAAVAEAPSLVTGALDARDTRLFADALEGRFVEGAPGLFASSFSKAQFLFLHECNYFISARDAQVNICAIAISRSVPFVSPLQTAPPT